MNRKQVLALMAALLMLALLGCGGEAPASQPAPKEGVVYVDPNAVPAATAAATAEPVSAEATAAPVEASGAMAPCKTNPSQT